MYFSKPLNIRLFRIDLLGSRARTTWNLITVLLRTSVFRLKRREHIAGGGVQAVVEDYKSLY